MAAVGQEGKHVVLEFEKLICGRSGACQEVQGCTLFQIYGTDTAALSLETHADLF